MGYVDKQIQAAQKKLGDAVAGKGLRAAIRKLQDKAKIRNSLEDPPARGSLAAKRKLAKATGSSQGDFNEKSRTFHTTLRELRSSDALFTIEYYNVHKIVMDRATFSYLDHDPDA